MKTVIVAAAALILGLFLGGFGPRAELRRAREELADAKEAAARASSQGMLPMALGLGALGAAAGGGERPGGPAPRDLPRFVVPDGGGSAVEPRGPDAPDGGGRRRRRFGLDEQSFAAAKTAADVRAAQLRGAFVDAARLPPEKQAALDQLVNKMNGDLGKAADELAEGLRTRGQKLAPRDLADVGARVLEIYRRSDDEFKAGLDDAGRAALGQTEFDLFTQFDLGAFRRLAEAADTLGVAGRERR